MSVRLLGMKTCEMILFDFSYVSLSVCLSGRLSVTEKKSDWTIIHISKSTDKVKVKNGHPK